MQKKMAKMVHISLTLARRYADIRCTCVIQLAQEIAALRKEAEAFKKVRDALRSPSASKKAPRMVFDKVAIDIIKLCVSSPISTGI